MFAHLFKRTAAARLRESIEIALEVAAGPPVQIKLRPRLILSFSLCYLQFHTIDITISCRLPQQPSAATRASPPSGCSRCSLLQPSSPPARYYALPYQSTLGTVPHSSKFNLQSEVTPIIRSGGGRP